MTKDISALRKEYTKGQLDASILGSDPLKAFRQWFTEALNSEVLEANAMILSTVSMERKPSSRVVLLKEITEEGIVFFTNKSSRKGQEIAQNPDVSVVFFWGELERQVRMEGRIRDISEEANDEYFYSRPRISQAGAVVSPQSQVISDRGVLDSAMNDWLADETKLIQRPAHWGGYEIVVNRIEFWQGRPGRVHDRIVFVLNENDSSEGESKESWNICRLAP
jgi:pyridoxamine 5'-phosphate oxidase